MKLVRISQSIILFFVILSQLFAQNQPPQVTNVLFSQRTDGTHTVDVYYDVDDPNSDAMTVTIQASDDNGATWNFSCDSISGDVDSNISSGTNKHIIWDFKSEHPQTFGDQFKIKIVADDGGTATGIPCPGLPTVTYEGKTYNTVLIGEQCWLRENLDVGTMIDSTQNQTDNSIIEKYCYNDNPSNCTIYGALYQWNEAMQYSTTPGTQGICPSGWHIPTDTECWTLIAAVNNDGNSLKEIGQGTGEGAGTNTSGFSALLAGFRYKLDSNFYYLGNITYLWLSRDDYITFVFFVRIGGNDSNLILYYGEEKDTGLSVRCLKD